MPRVNDQIGPYQLIKKLGRGGFGEVWLAKNVTAFVAREVALKIPHDEDVDLSAIKQEAEIWLAASGHPNVLPFIEANIYEDYVAIVSEYAPDGSLRDWLKQNGGRAPSIEAALEMTRGILNGLAHLHARNIIHRDLKPDNVLLQGTTPRITDFGIARFFDVTKSSIIAGTPVYMSPETFDAKRNQQTDIWSVGVMLYLMLVGRLPFTGQTSWEVEKAIRFQDLPPLSVNVPTELWQMVAKALEKQPVARFKTATEMLRALQASEAILVAPHKAIEPASPHKREIINIPLLELPPQAKPTPPKLAPSVGTAPDRIDLPKPYIENLNGVPLEMILVPAGKFTMGSGRVTFPDFEMPPHEVRISSFYIGKFQITQKQWKAVTGDNPSRFKGDYLPVESVSWHEAQAFCKKLRELTGRAYRLPSEAEWEYACRAGTTGDYAGKLDEMAWHNRNPDGKTHLVGQKKPNAFGLYDMHGNVWEWCEDVWHDNYNGAPNDGSAWAMEGDQECRVLRGGSSRDGDSFCRSAQRLYDDPGNRRTYVGLRVVVSAMTP
ncbi:MAG: SUMF1/EgtB/PvdO family nonheme iron enzyme [Blastocatellia bacterium]|nr:SUMF1/EgtB/PvdO family nonheme iron enzyme [Blastocatellia bacterium]